MEGCEGRTTITVDREIKDRFLKFVGAPKRFKSADEALTALMDRWEEVERKTKRKEEMEHGVKAD